MHGRGRRGGRERRRGTAGTRTRTRISRWTPRCTPRCSDANANRLACQRER